MGGFVVQQRSDRTGRFDTVSGVYSARSAAEQYRVLWIKSKNLRSDDVIVVEKGVSEK